MKKDLKTEETESMDIKLTILENLAGLLLIVGLSVVAIILYEMTYSAIHEKEYNPSCYRGNRYTQAPCPSPTGQMLY
jgi:hypothetical protein